ncbi:hypothetical protein [Actinomadura terrae]|uniref:hypothetical protein n=1 Tax=Actinomadura terrae TaxID=604353 RepID=UPI001FA7E455|nr:hypothetical protein [Actinomadura terrae]
MIIVDERMMVLGARVAEIEALYTCVLETGDPRARRRLLAQLARAGTRLSADARTSPSGRGAGPRPRLRRRIVRARRTADWIISRADGRSRSR